MKTLKPIKISYKSVILSVLILSASCKNKVKVQEKRVDFSPTGKQLASIEDIQDKNEKSHSRIIVSRVPEQKGMEAKSEDRFTAYESPAGVEIHSVFWTKSRMVFFESTQQWSCFSPPNGEKIKGEKVPQYLLRIASIPSSAVDMRTKSEPKIILNWNIDCWDYYKNGVLHQSDTMLDRSEISSSVESNLIVFNPLYYEEKGLYLLDTETGKIRKILEGRDIVLPSISGNGKMIAFLEGITEEIEIEGKKEEVQEVQLKIANIETGKETEISLVGGAWGIRVLWSRDNRFVFFTNEEDITATAACEKKYANYLDEFKVDDENEFIIKQYLLNPDDEEDFKILKHCQFYRRTVREEERDDDYVYQTFRTVLSVVYKGYLDYGIAVRIVDYPLKIEELNPFKYSFSINPRTENILIQRQKVFVGDTEGTFLLDYDGQVIKKVDNKYFKEFEDVANNGHSADWSKLPPVPLTRYVAQEKPDREFAVILDPAAEKEALLIDSKQELLSVARHHFSLGEYDKAKKFYEEFKDKYGLPEDPGERILMLDAYRHVGDYDKMVALLSQVPKEMLREYFRNTDSFDKSN